MEIAIFVLGIIILFFILVATGNIVLVLRSSQIQTKAITEMLQAMRLNNFGIKELVKMATKQDAEISDEIEMREEKEPEAQNGDNR